MIGLYCIYHLKNISLHRVVYIDYNNCSDKAVISHVHCFDQNSVTSAIVALYTMSNPFLPYKICLNQYSLNNILTNFTEYKYFLHYRYLKHSLHSASFCVINKHHTISSMLIFSNYKLSCYLQLTIYLIYYPNLSNHTIWLMSVRLQ